MHTLLHWATDEQKDKYLRPLCDGKTRSCFAMTEPEVAGSDPTLIQTRAVKDGDDWVINGHKWYISGAVRKSCKISIFLGKTPNEAFKRHQQQSMILVPVHLEGDEMYPAGLLTQGAPGVPQDPLAPRL